MSYRLPLCAVLLVGALFSGLVPARAGWWDDLDKGETARLSDLIAQPDRYRNQDVSFFCVFHQVDDVFNPLAKPFNAERYENLSAWTDGAPVWENDTFRHDYPFLYLRKSNPQYAQLANLPIFTRIEVTGRIRSVQRSMPYIEVLSFRPTSHRLGKLVVQSVMAGDRYAEMGDHELAYENYKRAMRPDLPPSYEMLVRKRVAEGLRRLGKTAEANALEGGPILANSTAPEPRPGARVAPEPDPTMPFPAPIASDLPGPPADLAPPPGFPAPMPEPGFPAPIPEPGFPPTAPAPLTEELPGVPAGPSKPLTEDLPGTPAAEADGILRAEAIVHERPPSALESVGPGTGTPSRSPTSDRVPGRLPSDLPSDLPGAPPRRAPRLTGAK